MCVRKDTVSVRVLSNGLTLSSVKLVMSLCACRASVMGLPVWSAATTISVVFAGTLLPVSCRVAARPRSAAMAAVVGRTISSGRVQEPVE